MCFSLFCFFFVHTQPRIQINLAEKEKKTTTTTKKMEENGGGGDRKRKVDSIEEEVMVRNWHVPQFKGHEGGYEYMVLAPNTRPILMNKNPTFMSRYIKEENRVYDARLIDYESVIFSVYRVEYTEEQIATGLMLFNDSIVEIAKNASKLKVNRSSAQVSVGAIFILKATRKERFTAEYMRIFDTIMLDSLNKASLQWMDLLGAMFQL